MSPRELMQVDAEIAESAKNVLKLNEHLELEIEVLKLEKEQLIETVLDLLKDGGDLSRTFAQFVLARHGRLPLEFMAAELEVLHADAHST